MNFSSRYSIPFGAAVLVVLGSDAVAQSLVCTNDSLERLVELRYDNPGEAVPCSIVYTKPAEGLPEQVLWRAENEEGYCEARFEAFVDKLSGWGWSCAEETGVDSGDDAEVAEAVEEAVPLTEADTSSAEESEEDPAEPE